VTLFFVLSGFLISTPFLAATRGRARVRLGSYVRRRVLRIYPLYVVAVLVATALTAKHAYEALPHLVFLTPFASLAPPLGIHSGVWWSLSTEAQFYALVPLVAWLAAPVGARPTALAVAALWALSLATIQRGWIPMTLESHVGWNLSLPGRAPAFAIGVLIAWPHLPAGPQIP